MEYTAIVGVNGNKYHVVALDDSLSKVVSLGYQEKSGVFLATAGKTPINYSLTATDIKQDCGSFSRLSQYSGVVLSELVSERGNTLGYSLLSCGTGEIVNLKTENIVKRDEALGGNIPFLQNGIIRNGAVCCYPNKPFIKVTVKGSTYKNGVRKKEAPLGDNKVNAQVNIVELILAGKAKPLTGRENPKEAMNLFVSALKECLNRNLNDTLSTILANESNFYKQRYLSGEMVQTERGISESFIIPLANTIEWLLGCPNFKLIYHLLEGIKSRLKNEDFLTFLSGYTFSTWCSKFDDFFASNASRFEAKAKPKQVEGVKFTKANYSTEQLTEYEICKKKGGNPSIIALAYAPF